MWRGPVWVTVLRDVLLLVLPAVGFVVEALKDKPSVELLVAYMALLSFPGLASAVFLVRHGGGTEPPPSPSPPSPPSPQPPSSSSSAS